MKKFIIGAIALTILVFFFVFKNNSSTETASNKLYIYNWTEYMSPDLINKFEAETGIQVIIDTYDSNPTLVAKLQSGADGYDIIVPSTDFIEILKKQGLIIKADFKKNLKNINNLRDSFLSPPWDRDLEYTVPFATGSSSFAINTKYIPATTDSYEVLFNPPKSAKGKVGMFSSAPDNIQMYFTYKNYPLCSENPEHYKEALTQLLKQKESVLTYNSDSIEDNLVSTDTVIQAIWNGNASNARKQNPDVKYIFPKEGINSWVDNFAIPKNAKNIENAYKFIDFYLQAVNAAMQTEYVAFEVPVKGIEEFLSDEAKSIPELVVPNGIKVNFQSGCSKVANDLLNKTWEQVKK